MTISASERFHVGCLGAYQTRDALELPARGTITVTDPLGNWGKPGTVLTVGRPGSDDAVRVRVVSVDGDQVQYERVLQ